MTRRHPFRSLIPIALVVAALPASAQLVSLGRDVAPVASHHDAAGTPPVPRFAPGDKEAYLNADQVAWIRPGLNIAILGVSNVLPGQKPVVEFTIADDLKQPLDRLGAETPGPVGLRFVMATWDADLRTYTNLQSAANGSPTRDTNGKFETLELGHYKYTFAAVLATFDPTKPMTLMVGGRRTLTDIIGKDYWAANTFKDFTPSTGAAATTWGATTLAKCNACHDPLAPHGGNYRDVKTCVMCHNPSNMKGDFAKFNGREWFHNIHAGHTEDVGVITFPQDLRNCETCHDAKAPAGSTWYSFPSRVACGSCHNNVNFATGEGHSAENLVQTDDTKCADCHAPQGDREFDNSVKGAHTVPFRSKQLKGLVATIVSVDQVGPGKNAIVTFKITNGDGSIVDPKTFAPANLNIVLGGPTSDYAINPFREAAATATFNGTLATYTMKAPFPTDASGTWAFSIEARRTVVLNQGLPKQQNFTEAAPNPVKYVSVTGGEPKPRRTVVVQAQCETCHDRLALHGGQRLRIEECVICHNPNASDAARRPASEGSPESISFQRMIHRIHTGEELTQDFTIFGFYTPPAPPNPVHFNEVTFPGDRRNCVKCHTATSFNVPPPAGTLNVLTPRDFFTPQGPGTAACLGCHDNRDAAAHAFINTAPFGEACGTCHGANADLSAGKVHAR